MSGIPQALTESAKIDGAGDFTIFIKIILPLVKPALATIGMFIALGYWNSKTIEEIDIPDSVSFVCSIDDQTTWKDYDGYAIDLKKGDKVYIKAKTINDNLVVDGDKFAFFKMTGGKVAASGNINTLLDPRPNAKISLNGKNYCYSYLFGRRTYDENWN